MTLGELVQILRATGYPVAFSHFDDDDMPSVPFITYTTPEDDAFYADNKNYMKITNVNIELYTNKKDLEAERNLESLLDEHELPYVGYQTYIETERLHQKTYEIGVI
ncbi:hypothetical protein AQ616_18870 [Oceanobacillus sp. E9]|uniref:hypothetical protein n=1 Tax=Oceanobacillus sp. E9 TaxID=1742575 RepID=UPI00084EB9FC|nr:hypothetical protein [Oceanobacillus sp. E9]OEH52968.1 hypothetical protein AQ616_18870 [Oceanobacillus sp. E9]